MVTIAGIKYYRARRYDADGKRFDINARSVEELEKIAGMAFFVNLPEKYRNDAVGKIDPYGDWRIR